MGVDENGVSLHLTWNSTHLFIGWEGTDWASTDGGADLFVYLNTSSGGTSLSKEWGLSHVLPFAADYAFVLKIPVIMQFLRAGRYLANYP